VNVAPSLAGLPVFRIGFVVRDFERAARGFDEKLGGGPWRGWPFGPQSFVEVVEPSQRMPPLDFSL